MGTLQFLSTLPALLGITGFVVYYFISRNRSGDHITLDIIKKLRKEAPELLPSEADNLDSTTLAQLIEANAALKSKVGDQDFHLLSDALHHQFITSVLVYGLCSLIFFAGIGFYVYTSSRPHPVAISSISAESTDPTAQGIPVDLDNLRVRWTAFGDPEDLKVSLEEMESGHRTSSKVVRSTEGQVVFHPEDYRSILVNRELDGQNRLRVVFQTAKSPYFSHEFSMRVGLTVMAVHVERSLRLTIIGTIDKSAIQNYNFSAKLLVWAKNSQGKQMPFTYGGHIQYGHNDFLLDPNLVYDWSTVKISYFGPDDGRIVRTEFNFNRVPLLP